MKVAVIARVLATVHSTAEDTSPLMCTEQGLAVRDEDGDIMTWPFIKQDDLESQINSLATGICSSNVKDIIFKLSRQNSDLGTHCEIAVR